MQPIAALYVHTGGCYFNLEGVKPFDKEEAAALLMEVEHG